MKQFLVQIKLPFSNGIFSIRVYELNWKLCLCYRLTKNATKCTCTYVSEIQLFFYSEINTYSGGFLLINSIFLTEDSLYKKIVDLNDDFVLIYSWLYTYSLLFLHLQLVKDSMEWMELPTQT